jgi:hypothetical protein
MDFHQAALSAVDQARFDTFAVELAEDALGAFLEEGEGRWRVAQGRGASVHPGALWFDFRANVGGRGALSLIRHLHQFDAAAAMLFARKWLAEHAGEGRLASGVPDEETTEKRELEDARRTAEIRTIFERRGSRAGTPVDLYLNKRGGLQADDSVVGWIEPAWPGGYGEMITAATDEHGAVGAVQLARLTPEGAKAPIKWQRITLRGPHDWSSHAALRLNCDEGPIDTLHFVEGFEDGLSLVAAGVRNIWVIWGLGRLGRIELPLGVKTVIVVRDDDKASSKAELNLWRGVVRLCGQGVDEVRITPRPRRIAPSAPEPMKDINDLHRHGGSELVQKLLSAAPVGKEDLTAAAREAIFDEASKLNRDAYALGKRNIAKQLGYTAVAPLDEDRNARIDKRMKEANKGDAPDHDEFILTPHEDPVTDLAPVLDGLVDVYGKVLASPATHLDTEALWAAKTHLLLRKELGIRHSARLAFQSQFEDSGKTTAMTMLKFCAARAMATSSLTGASLFRETDAHHWTVLWDEADNAFHKNSNPELIGVFNAGHDRYFAIVHRQVPSPDGGYETAVFDTFTGIAMTAIHEFPSKSMQSRCIVLIMKRATKADAARLVDFDETHEKALTECGRKLTRWAIDLEALPAVDKKDCGLINRIWLNWRPLLQIAKLAGGTWPARALAAAKADMARVTGEKDDSPEYALLDAIWRVFAADKSDPRRMLTCSQLLPKLFDEDEGRWRTAKNGKEIDEYYLRSKLKKLLPAEDECKEPRRWRADINPGGNQQHGYHELHLADAFDRYLNKGLPSGKPRPSDLPTHDGGQAPQPAKSSSRQGGSPPLSSDHPSQRRKREAKSNTSAETDKKVDPAHETDEEHSHPSQTTPETDTNPADPSHETDVGAASVSPILERFQCVNTLETDETDKSVGDPPPAEGMPAPDTDISSAEKGIIQFPRTPSGRKHRAEP